MELNEIEKINNTNEQLKKIVEFKSSLISTNVHSFRTTLTAMKWALKMFLDKDLGELTSEQESFIKKIYENNEEMIEKVEEVLFLNNNTETEIVYHLNNLDIINLIENVIFNFIGEAHKKNLEIIFLKPEEKILLVFIDKIKIKIVLENLIENAIKYSNQNDQIFISLTNKNGFVEVSVKDNGIGIKEDDQNHIFNQFFRSTNAQEKEDVGSGLGLFISKEIIKKHNGEIWFESKKNNGSTFFFTIPLAKT